MFLYCEVTVANIEVRVAKISGRPKNWFQLMEFCHIKLIKIWDLQYFKHKVSLFKLTDLCW